MILGYHTLLVNVYFLIKTCACDVIKIIFCCHGSLKQPITFSNYCIWSTFVQLSKTDFMELFCSHQLGVLLLNEEMVVYVAFQKTMCFFVYWYNRPVETDGAGRGGCSTSLRFLLNFIFDELKKIVLKWKLVQNRKTGWNSSKFIDFAIDIVTWNNNSRGKCGRFSEKYRKCGRYYKAI